MRKVLLDADILTAARARISYIFETFSRVYVSFSGGKDSSVMLHLVAEEAKRRGRRFGLLFIDLEAQYRLTIEHVAREFERYRDIIDPHWICLPIHLRNAVSMSAPYWTCWDPDQKDNWVRQPPEIAITDPKAIPWFWEGMEFEEFVELFGEWYGEGYPTACFVGIRSDESINRWRTIAAMPKKQCFRGHRWTTWINNGTFNVYPIYDWSVEDIWTYVARAKAPYNQIYDLMHQAGLTPAQMRICQPYGDDQRKGLHLYHVMEPETWSKVVARVVGANSGALYSQESGNILGNRKVTLPQGHTWKSFARLLLDSLPAAEREQYEEKISVFLHWYETRGYPDGIPDEADPKQEAAKKVPSWRRIVKVILKNDRLCKGLSFGQQKSTPNSYEKHKAITQKRMGTWRRTF